MEIAPLFLPQIRMHSYEGMKYLLSFGGVCQLGLGRLLCGFNLLSKGCWERIGDGEQKKIPRSIPPLHMYDLSHIWFDAWQTVTPTGLELFFDSFLTQTGNSE